MDRQHACYDATTFPVQNECLGRSGEEIKEREWEEEGRETGEWW
jgi:hypothetical protein